MKRWAGLVFVLGAALLLWLALGPTQVPESSLGEPVTSSLPQGLSQEGIARLRNWLLVTNEGQAEPPERDIFRVVARPAVPQRALVEPAVTALVPPIQVPELAGFVLRDEDSEVSRVLAAIRFEGRVWLVGEGELVGSYRVQRIVLEDEEVFLVDEGDGQVSRLGID